MAFIDLRTIYTGNLDSTRKHHKEMNAISASVTAAIHDALISIESEADQSIVRSKLIELSDMEAQLADIHVRMHGSDVDSTVQVKLNSILDSLRKSITRVERVLASYMNQANNDR